MKQASSVQSERDGGVKKPGVPGSVEAARASAPPRRVSPASAGAFVSSFSCIFSVFDVLGF